MNMKGRANISKLHHEKGGIPETGRVNKNREALFWFDRGRFGEKRRLKEWLEDAIEDLNSDTTDCIIITVKERTW